jgi:hypothetical protein
MKTIKLIGLFSLVLLQQLNAQTLTDGLMMPKKNLCTGVLYTTDSWKNYWEGTLKRDNPNIGTITTNSAMWVGSYGLTERINLIAMVPYVWTKSSGPTLHPMQGIQDLTLGGKYRLFKKEFQNSSIKTFAGVSFSIPLTNYTPDYLPLSIGLMSKTLAVRANAVYTLAKSWYASASGSYVFRSNITLDRPSYYTDGQLFLTNVVAMPNQFQFFGSLGYKQPNWQAEVNYNQQNTLGGGDIRRQDMPFASNRMNYAKLGVMGMYYLSVPKGLAVRAGASYTVAGRNVGQSTMYSAGLLYTIQFKKEIQTN